MKDSEEESPEESMETFHEGCDGEKLDKIFKKPILVGKIGKLPKRLPSNTHDSSEANTENEISGIQEPQSNEIETEPQSSTSNAINEKSQQLHLKDAEEEPISNTAPAHPLQNLEKTIPLPYKEPVWSGLPVSNGKNYSLDVLKNGSIIERINLMNKQFWVFGRLSHCNISMEHPTISRYHAVLQYNKEPSEADGPGFYIYDLDSTHGTFLNKNRLKPKVFVRIQVGHMLKLGCSTRSYILVGPEFDEEEESELTVTELKQKRAQDLSKREEEALRKQKEMEEQKKREEERGVDWGLGEDADEETDLSENPYAQTNNEELYLDDPKKALRGFFEREGLDLEYRCDEQGIGQFICKVDLPVDDEMGRTIVAEVLHKGKKKEAVVQCALEACRILDRHGVLRQATHESRKKKAKNWEENDFYDSDEDTFLDRTGTIEKKREKRMNAKAPQKVETYESLVEREKCIAKSIKDIETQISTVQNKMESDNNRCSDEDSLDSYMKNLTDSNVDKRSIAKLKVDLSKLKTEQAKIVRLINLVKPANLPPLAVKEESSASTSKESTTKSLPIFGKRRKIQFKFEQKSKYDLSSNYDMDDEDDDDTEDKKDKVVEKTTEHQDPVTNVTENQPETVENTSEIEHSSNSSTLNVEQDETAASTTSACLLKILEGTMAFKEFDSILKKGFPSYTGKYRDKLEKIIDNIKNLASNEDRMRVDLKMLSAKNDKVTKLLADMKRFQPPDEKMEHRAWSELDRILVELSAMAEEKFKVLGEVKKMGNEIKNIFEDQKNQTLNKSTSSVNERLVGEENTDNVDLKDDRRKRKNQKRIQHRQGKQEQDRQKEYEADASREDYNMWVPPGDQSGDGRTSLNDKLGY